MGTFLDGWNFKAAPYIKKSVTVGPSPLGDGGFAPNPWEGTTQDVWELNPEAWAGESLDIGGIMRNPNNVEMQGVDENGNFILKVKSADKAGTTYRISPEGKNLGAEGTVAWDTNAMNKKMLKHAGMGLALMAGGALLAPGASSGFAIPGAHGLGMAEAAAGLGAGMPATLGGAAATDLGAGLVGEAGAGSLGAGSSWVPEVASAFPEAMTADGLVNAGSGLGASGMTGGAWSTPGLTTAAEAGTGLSLPSITNAADLATKAIGNLGTSNLASKSGSVLEQISKLVGKQGNVTDLLDMIMKGYDAYNKFSSGKKKIELADKLFGHSAQFENQLADTYTNPDAWLQGPEGQAMKRIRENQLLRTDSRAGNLSNDTKRTILLQDHMMKGLNDYRSSLADAAKIGRGPATAISAALEAGLMDKGQWPSVFSIASAYGGGKGTKQLVEDISTAVTTLKKLGEDGWDWLSDLFTG